MGLQSRVFDSTRFAPTRSAPTPRDDRADDDRDRPRSAASPRPPGGRRGNWIGAVRAGCRARPLGFGDSAGFRRRATPGPSPGPGQEIAARLRRAGTTSRAAGLARIAGLRRSANRRAHTAAPRRAARRRAGARGGALDLERGAGGGHRSAAGPWRQGRSAGPLSQLAGRDGGPRRQGQDATRDALRRWRRFEEVTRCLGAGRPPRLPPF